MKEISGSYDVYQLDKAEQRDGKDILRHLK